MQPEQRAGTLPPSTMRRFVVENDHGPDLEFEGEILVRQTHHDVGSVTIHRTASGKYIVKQKLSSRPGVVVRNEVRIFESAAEAADWIGNSRGGKAIREALGLPTTWPVP